MLPTAPILVVLVGTAVMRILNHAIRHFSYTWKVLSKPRFRVMFREVFYAQARGNESLNIFILRRRVQRFFSLVVFACHLVFTLTLTILSIWDDLSLVDDDDFAFELTLSLSLDVLTFARDDALLLRLLQCFSLPACTRRIQRPPPEGKLDISACSSSLRTLRSRILKISY